MRYPNSGLRIDSPAHPLLQVLISYWGQTDGAGNALGTTLVDSQCSAATLQPSYVGLGVKILDGGAAGQVRTIMIHNLANGTLTVSSPFTDSAGAAQQIVAGIRFIILSTAGGGGGAGPAPPPAEVSLWMWGACDPGMVASNNTIVCTNLAGRFDDDVFNDEFWMQVVHNDNAPGVAPEREIRRILDFVGATATFTVDPFTANVEADDYVAIFHESIMGIEILGFGTLTLSSATVPEDNTRTEANLYFAGCLLMPTEGACRFQPRRIIDSTPGTGVPGTGKFYIDPSRPFTAPTGLVDYVIIGDQTEFVPAADSLNNVTPSDVVGSKVDTPDYTRGATQSSLVRLIKGILGAKVIAEGTFTTSDATVPIDTGRTEASLWFDGCILMPIAGAVAFQPRRIMTWDGILDRFFLDPNHPFTAAPGLVDYVVLADADWGLPTPDYTGNNIPAMVLGNKASTPVYIPDDASDIIRYLKGILNLVNISGRPGINLYEGWQDEAGIDNTIWTVTNPATGAAWSRGATGAYLRATSAPNANETCRLRSDQRWIAAPDVYGTNTVLRRLIIEFELRLTNVANIDNTLFFLGLTTGVADNRGSNNIIGWGLLADALRSITDDGGVETTDTGFGETLTNWNKLRIEISAGDVSFFLNETRVAQHTTNLPDFPFYLNFFIDTEGGGGATPEIGIIRVWTEDINR